MKIQECSSCGDCTGRCEDDSIYFEVNKDLTVGPLCEDCRETEQIIKDVREGKATYQRDIPAPVVFTPIEVIGCSTTHWGISDCQECGLKVQYQANAFHKEK